MGAALIDRRGLRQRGFPFIAFSEDRMIATGSPGRSAVAISGPWGRMTGSVSGPGTSAALAPEPPS